jgi:hypothetical protein
MISQDVKDTFPTLSSGTYPPPLPKDRAEMMPAERPEKICRFAESDEVSLLLSDQGRNLLLLFPCPIRGLLVPLDNPPCKSAQDL